MARGHSLITYAKKVKFLTLFPCEYTVVHFSIYTPYRPLYTCIHKTTNYEQRKLITPLHFILILQKRGLLKRMDLSIFTLADNLWYILKTTSRQQLVHASKHGGIIINGKTSLLKSASLWSRPCLGNLSEARKASSPGFFLQILNSIFRSIN